MTGSRPRPAMRPLGTMPLGTTAFAPGRSSSTPPASQRRRSAWSAGWLSRSKWCSRPNRRTVARYPLGPGLPARARIRTTSYGSGVAWGEPVDPPVPGNAPGPPQPPASARRRPARRGLDRAVAPARQPGHSPGPVRPGRRRVRAPTRRGRRHARRAAGPVRRSARRWSGRRAGVIRRAPERVRAVRFPAGPRLPSAPAEGIAGPRGLRTRRVPVAFGLLPGGHRLSFMPACLLRVGLGSAAGLVRRHSGRFRRLLGGQRLVTFPPSLRGLRLSLRRPAVSASWARAKASSKRRRVRNIVPPRRTGHVSVAAPTVPTAPPPPVFS